MARAPLSYHVSPDGVARACSTSEENCPFKGKHYASKAEAQFAARAPARRYHLATSPDVADWSNPRSVLFSTPHGSRLYGLAHANSDEDYFVVYPPSGMKVKQSIVDGIDATRMSFSYFVNKANEGSHQALEAMFSREATVDHFAAFRRNYYAAGPQVLNLYMRTIRNFSMGETYKRRRHALRLALNINDILRGGRFEPRLTDAQIKLVSSGTNEGIVPDERYIDVVRSLAPVELRYDFEHEGQSLRDHIHELTLNRQAKQRSA